MPVLEFDPPDRFVAGTVGPPGQRTFFLQVSAGMRLTSVSLEKQQLSTLADRVNDLLDDFAAGEAAEVVAAWVGMLNDASSSWSAMTGGKSSWSTRRASPRWSPSSPVRPRRSCAS